MQAKWRIRLRGGRLEVVWEMSRMTVALLVFMGLCFVVARKMLMGGENLPLEDGVSSAQVLPLDKASSEVAFQTATFGLG